MTAQEFFTSLPLNPARGASSYSGENYGAGGYEKPLGNGLFIIHKYAYHSGYSAYIITKERVELARFSPDDVFDFELPNP